jgi:BolA protein
MIFLLILKAMAPQKKKSPKKQPKKAKVKKRKTTTLKAKVKKTIQEAKAWLQKPLPPLADQDLTASEILKRVRDALAPTKLSLKNMSEGHKKHKSAKQHGGGHYSLSIISEVFSGLNIKQRQEWVNGILSDLYNKSIHALQMDLKSPAEDPLKSDKDLTVPFKTPKPEDSQS